LIPYFKFPSWHLGPFTLEVFGVMVVLGVFTGARLAHRQAEKRGLDPNPLADYNVWAVGAGVVVAHFFHLFLYHPEELVREGPLQILKVWDGLSSTGGIVGALLAAAWFFHRRKLSFNAYADPLALGTAPGWSIARIGCFLVHDHPGIRTTFPLSVAFPGGARHDLGLDDAIALALMSGVLYLAARNKYFNGRLLPLLALMYGISRFFLDFLRAADLDYVDKRYAGLTPAQYACFLLVGYGLYGLLRRAAAAGPVQRVTPATASQAPGPGSPP